jgi:hypothetical protein
MAAVPRPLLIGLLAAVLAAVAFYATRGGAAAPPTAPSPAVQATPKPGAPRAPTKQAVSPTKPSGSAASKTPSKPDAKPARPKSSRTPAQPKPAAASVQARVSGTLGRKVVVVFFRQRVGADDSATAAAVKSVRGTKGVAVFSDRISHLRNYPRVIGGLGITQAPAVVVIDKKREARLVEGYIDSGSLRQQVADAR